jgi:uncharacterized protein
VVKSDASQRAEPQMSEIEDPAQSPCVGNCCLDDDLTCLGCFRSLEEVKEWAVVDEHRRRIILQNAKERRKACETSEPEGRLS